MNTKIKRVTLRMTFKEHEELIKAANNNNVNMSQYMRQHIPELKEGKA